MKIETYLVTLQHDNEISMIEVVSLNGRSGAIQQVMSTEGCPEIAIIKIQKISSDKVL